MHTYIHAYIHTYIHSYMHIHTYMHAYIHTYIHTIIQLDLPRFTVAYVQVASVLHPASTCAGQCWYPVPLTVCNFPAWWCFPSINKCKCSTCTSGDHPLQFALVVLLLVALTHMLHAHYYIMEICTMWWWCMVRIERHKGNPLTPKCRLHQRRLTQACPYYCCICT